MDGNKTRWEHVKVDSAPCLARKLREAIGWYHKEDLKTFCLTVLLYWKSFVFFGALLFSWKFPVVLEVPVAAFCPVRNCVEPYKGVSQKDVENFFPPVKLRGRTSWCFQKFRIPKTSVKLRYPDFSSHNVCLIVTKNFVRIVFGFYVYLPALVCFKIFCVGNQKRAKMRNRAVIFVKK